MNTRFTMVLIFALLILSLTACSQPMEIGEQTAPAVGDAAVQILPEETNDISIADDRPEMNYARAYAEYLQNEVIPLYGLADVEAVRGVYEVELNESSDCLGVISAEVRDMDGDEVPELVVLTYEMVQLINWRGEEYERIGLCLHAYTETNGNIEEIPYEDGENLIRQLVFSPIQTSSIYTLSGENGTFLVSESEETDASTIWSLDVWRIGKEGLEEELRLYIDDNTGNGYEFGVYASVLPEEYQDVNYPQGYAGDARLYYREYDPEAEDGTMRIKVLDEQFFLSAEQAVRAMVVKYFGGFAIISDESKYDGGYPIAVSPGEGTIQNLLLESMWDNRASLPQMP